MLIFIIPIPKKAENLFSEEIAVLQTETIEQTSSRGIEELRQNTENVVEEEVSENVNHISERGIQFLKDHEGFIGIAKKYKGEKHRTIRISDIMEQM